MTRLTMDRARMGELLGAAGRGGSVWAPVASAASEPVVELELVATESGATPALERLVLDYTNTLKPAKRLFFPQTEVMLRFDSGEVTDARGEPSCRVVLFGIRPCDALSLTYLDKVFAAGLTQYGDPYYTERRARAVILTYACSSPCSSCFCTAVGSGPAGTAGADVLVTDLAGSRLLFDAVTDKGRSFLEEQRSFFAEADGKAQAAATAAHERAEAAVPRLRTPSGRVERDELKGRMDASFESPVWKGLTERCIGCGACTYLCPTCHCFDISDEERAYRGRRIRSWDSCQYPLFTKHASGHNPRPTRAARLRQRFMHKFSYTVEKSGDIYCVGCGRCVTRCPVNLDVREVIRTFSESGA